MVSASPTMAKQYPHSFEPFANALPAVIPCDCCGGGDEGSRVDYELLEHTRLLDEATLAVLTGVGADGTLTFSGSTPMVGA